MKSFKKLISFNNHKGKEKRNSTAFDSADPRLTIADEWKEMRELTEMRNQYEGLCAVSSLVSNRALDFSTAIQDLATYFIDTFGSSEDGEMSKVFKILGRVQYEISKLLDLYANHVTQTITEPTEILLTELRNVQDSKQQHDEKRQLYEQLRARIAKGRPRNGKGEAFADQQLHVVKDEFDKLSLHVNTRFSSLEQSQARSLISQAARHHTAQMHLFSRGHSSLQAVDPYMRQIVREQNIDRQLSGRINDMLEPEDDSDMKSEDDVSYIDEHDDYSDPQSVEQSNRWDGPGDSPERSPNNQDENAEVPKNLSKEWNSLISKLHRRTSENSDLRDLDNSGSGPQVTNKQQQGSASGQLNGISVEKDTIQITELVEDPHKSANGSSHPLSPPLRRPPDIPGGSMRGPDEAGFNMSEINSKTVSTSGRTSSDADQGLSNSQKDSSGIPSKPSYPSVPSEAFKKKLSSSLSTPAPKLPGKFPTNGIENLPTVSFLSPTLSSTPVGFTSHMKDGARNGRRFSQSGPLTSNGTTWSGQPQVGTGIPSAPQSVSLADGHKSGPLGRSPLGRTFGSPRISPALSPPSMSPPRISELHKLPPPPLNPIKSKSTQSQPLIAHSAPLSRHQDPLATSALHATPLPPPPLGSTPRSQSLNSRSRLLRSKAPTFAQVPEVNEEVSPRSSFNAAATGNITIQTNTPPSHKQVLSENNPGQEIGLPFSDLKFVHFDAAKSASGTPILSSLQMKPPPSPSARGGKEKSQPLDTRRADPPSQNVSSMISGGVLNTPRWRSLSINDKDDYIQIQNIAKAVAMQREYAPELVFFHPT